MTTDELAHKLDAYRELVHYGGRTDAAEAMLAGLERALASAVPGLVDRIAVLEKVLAYMLCTNSYVQGKAWQSGECFYCAAPWDEDGDNHAPDCLLMQAERLLEEAKP